MTVLSSIFIKIKNANFIYGDEKTARQASKERIKSLLDSNEGGEDDVDSTKE